MLSLYIHLFLFQRNYYEPNVNVFERARIKKEKNTTEMLLNYYNIIYNNVNIYKYLSLD